MINESMVPRNFKIRQATIADLPTIVTIWEEGSLKSLGIPLPQEVDFVGYFRERLLQQDEIFRIWVAEDDNGLLGWQALTAFRANPVLRSLQAESSTYVSKSSGGRGVGKTLLRQALQHAINSRLQYVVGFVGVGNEPMLRITAELGFKRVGRIESTKKTPGSPDFWFLTYTVACGE